MKKAGRSPLVSSFPPTSSSSCLFPITTSSTTLLSQLFVPPALWENLLAVLTLAHPQDSCLYLKGDHLPYPSFGVSQSTVVMDSIQMPSVTLDKTLADYYTE
jgi:hypothetical protein